MKKIALLLILSLFLACNGLNGGGNGGIIPLEPIACVEPACWIESSYLELNPDVAADSYYGKFPLQHWCDFGQFEGRKYKTIPVDWEDAAYLYLYPDVIESPKYGSCPLSHYIEWGKAEGRVWKPEGWSSAQYLINNKDVAADAYYGTHPLEHWWKYGKAEGRTYFAGWMPPKTQGLHLILEQKTKKEYFSVMRIPKGLLIGQYGLYEGGPESA